MNRPPSLPETIAVGGGTRRGKPSWTDWPPLFFFRQFLAHPLSVGSIVPTSTPAIDALLAHVDWARARVIVEYGPGTGVFTRAMLARAHPDAVVVAIDTNRDFIAYLERTVRDARLLGVTGSAADVEVILGRHGLGGADVILSGLPFSTLPAGVGEQIAAATAHALSPQGSFLVYQYSRAVSALLGRHFSKVDEQRVWRCVPPARLFIARQPRTT